MLQRGSVKLGLACAAATGGGAAYTYAYTHMYTPMSHRDNHRDPENGPLAAVSSSGSGSGSDTVRNIRLSLDAARRVGNLTLTALCCAVDYGYVLNTATSSGNMTDYEQLALQLSTLQADQEVTTLTLWKSSTDEKEKAALELRIKQNRVKINEISEKMAACKEDTALTAAHERSAKRLHRMCVVNRGLYIKLGQHISMLDHIIPKAYQLELSQLLNNNPHSSWESVSRIIQEDLGDTPDNLFQSFNREPIASASLAQVHVAVGKDGRQYAVKVQHEFLRESCDIDRLAITVIIELLSKVFSKFDFKWLAREMNVNLPMELDFTNDLRNMARCKANLAGMIRAGDVAIPSTFPHLCSARVLTMSFEEGVMVTDADAIKAMGIAPASIARTISKMFCEQIFRHGFVHCDPHEANFFIRPNTLKPGAPQIVLLDHGLYRSLDDNVRRNYCRLWKAITSSDEEGIKYYCTQLNAGAMYTLFSAILTMRPWDDITSDDLGRLKNNETMGDKVMLKAYANRYVNEILTLMRALPSDILVLLKTNDCLRHIDRKLGAPINTIAVSATVTSDVVLKEDWQSDASWYGRINTLQQYSRTVWKLYGLWAIEYALYWKLDRWLDALWPRSSS